MELPKVHKHIAISIILYKTLLKIQFLRILLNLSLDVLNILDHLRPLDINAMVADDRAAIYILY